MSVSRNEVRAMAALARLRLDHEEAERLAGDLSRILDHVDRLDALDPGAEAVWAELAEQGHLGVEEDVDAPGIPDRLHASPEESAPEWDHGFFLVPPPEGVDPDAS